MPSQTTPYLRLSAEDEVGPLLLDGRAAFVTSEDGRAVLWCNAAGAALFEARSIPALLRRDFGLQVAFSRQVTQIVRSLPFGRRRQEMLRLPSLRARALAAACLRLRLDDGRGALLVMANAPATRHEPVAARAARLAELLAEPDGAAALLAPGGAVLGASSRFADIDRDSVNAHLATEPQRPLTGMLRDHGLLRRFEAGDAALAEGRPLLLLIGVPEAQPAAATPPLLPAETPSAEVEAAPLAEPVGAAGEAPDKTAAAVVETSPAVIGEAGPEPAPEPILAEPVPAEPAEATVEVAEAPAELPTDTAAETAPEAPQEGADAPGSEADEGIDAAPAERDVQPAAGEDPVHIPAPHTDPVRFVFQMDDRQHFTMASPEFASVVGPISADVVGRSFAEIVEAFGLTDSEPVGAALSKRDTWSGVTVYWPVDGADYRIAVDLAALPAFSRDRSFEGFRGFGVCRPADRRPVQVSVKLAPPDEAAAGSVTPDRPASGGFVPTLVQGSAERSNVVRLPTAAAEKQIRPAVLSGMEQDAFRRIAEALGAQQAGEAAREAVVSQEATAPSLPAVEAIAAEASEPARPAPAAKAPALDLRLLDRLPLGVLVLRAERILFANRAFLDLLGYGAVEDFIASGGLDALFEVGARGWIAEQDDRRSRELVARRADGTELPVEARLQTAPLGDGTVLVLSLRQRIASAPAMNELAAELRAAKARVGELEAILDTATDGVVVVGRDGRIVNFNKAAEALFSVESSDALGQPFVDFLAEESRRPALDYLDGLAENGVASVLNDGREVIGRVAERGLIPLFMTMGRIGASELYCAVLRDITQWKKAEEDLIAARRAAEAASTQKSEFLAKISHEIRTPLNAVIGFSEVMMEERFGPIGNERYREYLRDIHVSGSHLMSLINDLLDLSKIEAGKIELSFDAVAVNGIIQECVALMQPQANRERIIIRTSLSHDVPNVVADPRSLRQIVLNLLSNAVKFTMPGGQVIVSSSIEESGEVVVRIRDTGIGMSEKDLEAAMKPFRQLATSGRERFDGTGLGLPLTKALVEANRAVFTIDSAVNQGTMVRISFPPPRVLAG